MPKSMCTARQPCGWSPQPSPLPPPSAAKQPLRRRRITPSHGASRAWWTLGGRGVARAGGGCACVRCWLRAQGASLVLVIAGSGGLGWLASNTNASLQPVRQHYQQHLQQQQPPPGLRLLIKAPAGQTWRRCTAPWQMPGSFLLGASGWFV